MRTHVAGVASLCERAIWIRCAVGINGVRAVVLLVGFAVFAGQIGADLSTNAYAVPDFNRLDVLANFYGFANDFVADTDWKGSFAPATVDGVDIRAATVEVSELSKAINEA